LKAVPKTADSLSLLAEAQLDMGHRGDAAKTAEQAIALESHHEGARLLLSRVRISEGSYDAALAAVAPIVESAVSGRDFGRAGNALGAILQADGAHRGTLKKLAEVREAEGNPPEAARLRLALAQEYERSGDVAAAIENYQRVLAAIPGQADARGRLAELDPSAQTAPPPAAAPRAAAPPASRPGASSPGPAHEIEIEEPVAPPPASAPARPQQPDAPVLSSEEQEIETLVVEAEVFAKYGLTDKAVERLRSLVRRRPDLLPARERLVQLMQDSNNPALQLEAEALAEIYGRAGRAGDAVALLERLGFGAAPPPSPPPASTIQIPFDEFDLEGEAPVRPPDLPEGPRTAAASSARPDEAPPEVSPEPAREEAVPHRHATPFEPAAPMDSDFVSYEELGSLLEEEMHRAGDALPAPPSKPAAVVEDQNLFADEQQFFNLAEELEKELADDAPPPSAPAMAGPEGEASLEEIFREFKRGVEQQLSAEDYETHFNLGIAYKEMGLVDEAIGEFQLASKDPARAVECCSMLGLCFLEKGMPQLAIKWYRKGLEAGDIEESVTVGLLYDLGCVYQSTGDVDLAYRTFLEVYGLNTNYRDVVHRVKDLQEVRGT
jgi:tetratricopeptide (TPR) repeat protein